MLYTKTVEPSTLGLIREIQQKTYMQNFMLVGGTALAKMVFQFDWKSIQKTIIQAVRTIKP